MIPYHGRWTNMISYDSDELEYFGTEVDQFGKNFKDTLNLDDDGDGVVDASEFHKHGKHHNAKFRKEKDANHADLNFKGNAAAERAEMLRANDENNDGVLDAWEKPQW